MQLPVSSNLFDTFGGGGATPGGTNGMGSMGSVTPTLVVPQMSASCPANVKNEMGIMSPGGNDYHGNSPVVKGNGPCSEAPLSNLSLVERLH